eukprot:CAMPEP_0194205088 /NCGR_PEP_ID=MMETSP0156-20130528/4428_1 /TAXON_ID=33649 /ORGANISM="Thalassionema nitzschioides, Strain L26-B" /LENGTH=171 /DNA_ID=CAMNT_0038931261 /DNA_START=160 /DNA_END=675 /DNA_ORIENTATION=-
MVRSLNLKPTFALDANDPIPDTAPEEEEPVASSEASTIPQSLVSPAMSQPPPGKRLDPLLAALTRDDQSGSNSETKNVPFFGEVSVDGGLVVLLPAAFIAVVGVISSFVVAFQSRDAIVSSIMELSNGVSEASLSTTNQVPVDGTCRGLCSSQDEQLDAMRNFMQSISGKR